MSTTLQVTRLSNGRPGTAIDLVHSPDDDAYYLHHYDFINKRDRTSVKVYPTAEEARADWSRGTLEWEPWS